MQERFIEIHQVFETNEGLDTFLAPAPAAVQQ